MAKVRVRKARRSLTPAETVVDIPFPIKGVDQSMPRSKQDPLTCTDAQNVRPFPPFSDRLGGGKRPGTRRAFTAATTPTANQPNTIIGLNAIPGMGASAAALQDLSYVYPTAHQTGYPSPTGSWTTQAGATSNTHTVIDDVHGSGNDADYVTTQPRVSGVFDPTANLYVSEMRWTCGAGGAVPVAGTAVTLFFRWRTRMPTDIDAPSATASYDAVVAQDNIDSVAFASSREAAGTATPTQITVDASDEPNFVPCAFRLRARIFYDHDGAGDWRELVSESIHLGGMNDWGDVEVIAPDLSAVPAGVWTNAGRLAIAIDAGENGVCGDMFTDIAYAHLGWLEGGTVPPAPPARADVLLVLLDDKCYVASLNDDDLNTPATSTGLVLQYPSIAYYNGLWYVVDGGVTKKITNADPPVVSNWTAATAGTIPPNCRLVSTFRNRAVLARQEGVANGETFWFMSAIGDFEDWDYAASGAKPAETSAIAGVNKFLGTPADAITALIAWSDDLFVFGCASSLWRLDGDPGYNGTLMCITRQTGVLGDRAWCFDEFGHLWFMGSSGLYKLERGGTPENISGRRLYRELDRIDASRVLIQLVYDAFSKTVHIFLTPTTAGAVRETQRHFVYDIGTDSFWPDVYPSRFGPHAVCKLTGATDDDRRFLMGGVDGHIRRPFDGGRLTSAGLFAPTGTARYGTGDDMKRDGTAIAGSTAGIESSVRFAPITAPNGEQEIVATEIVAYGTDNNLPLALPLGPLSWYWLVADSASTVCELAAVANARSAGMWFGPANYGQQEPVGLREAGGAHQLVIRQNSASQSWALDSIVVKFVGGGRRR